MLNIFQKLKLEEGFLILTSLILFFWLIFLNLFFPGNLKFLLKDSFFAINLAIKWWYQGFIDIFFLYLFFKIGFFLHKKILPSQKEESKEKIYFSKKDWQGLFSFLKISFLILLSFSLASLLNGKLTKITQERLISEGVLKWDEKIFGNSPVFWLNSSDNPYRPLLKIISPLAVNSFFSLSLLMSIFFFLFYLEKNNYFFKGFVISSFLILLFAFPLWYFFPAHSPLNAFIAPEKIKKENYKPLEKIKTLQEKLWQEQKENLPVSTFPSMHWGWGTILIYYLLRKKKFSLFFTLPWFFFLALGSLILGCHYFVDGVVGILLAILSIILSEKLISFERRVKKEREEKEEIFKEKLKNFLSEPFFVLLRLLKG